MCVYCAMIYYITAADGTGPIKIGTAGNPYTRLSQVQTHNWVPLILLAVEDGGPEREDELHERFKASCLRGEWFNRTDDLMAYLSTLPVINHPTGREGKQAGEKNAAWKGEDADPTTKRQRVQRLAPNPEPCYTCGKPGVDRKPLDGDPNSTDPLNVGWFCRKCSMEMDGRMANWHAVLKRPKSQPPKVCRNCTRPAKPLRNGRCGACAECFRRTGQERVIVT